MISPLVNWNTSNKLLVISFKDEVSILSHRIICQFRIAEFL